MPVRLRTVLFLAFWLGGATVASARSADVQAVSASVPSTPATRSRPIIARSRTAVCTHCEHAASSTRR